MTTGQQFLMVISIAMLLINIAISSFFTYRSYKKNPQRERLEQIVKCGLVFMFSFTIVGVIMLPVWAFFAFATYDRRAEFELQQQSLRVLLVFQAIAL